MKRLRVLGVITAALVLTVGGISPVFAQRAPGPEPRHQEYYGGGGGRFEMKGFCYSGRTQTCSSIFARPTESEIATECSQTGWHRYFAFQHGREAQAHHNQVCRN
jgi:hypothetical protein